jgi:hypothetical protein
VLCLYVGIINWLGYLSSRIIFVVPRVEGMFL